MIINEKKMTHKEYILSELKAGKIVSRLSVFFVTYKFKTPSRISELRAEGHDIKDRTVSKINGLGENISFKEYWIEQPEQGMLNV